MLLRDIKIGQRFKLHTPCSLAFEVVEHCPGFQSSADLTTVVTASQRLKMQEFSTLNSNTDVIPLLTPSASGSKPTPP